LVRLVSLFREILRNVEMGLLVEELIKQGYPAKEAVRKAQLMVTQSAHANRGAILEERETAQVDSSSWIGRKGVTS